MALSTALLCFRVGVALAAGNGVAASAYGNAYALRRPPRCPPSRWRIEAARRPLITPGIPRAAPPTVLQWQPTLRAPSPHADPRPRGPKP